LNQIISSNEESTSGNIAKKIEPIKQHDELVVVKKLSAESINDKENEEEQVSNNITCAVALCSMHAQIS
jgi:hypothetical protein